MTTELASPRGAADPGAPSIPEMHTSRAQALRELARRDAILQAVALAADAFLRGSDFEASTPQVLERFGRAATVSRVYVFASRRVRGRLLSSQRHEWVAPGVTPGIGDTRLHNVPLAEVGFGRWEDVLSTGGMIHGLLSDLPVSERAFLSSRGVRSVAVMPIFRDDDWWGFIGFDDSAAERAWSRQSLAALRLAADLFGGMLTRQEHDERYRAVINATAKAAERRAEFLAEASRILISSFDTDTTLARFARLAVPLLGDYCVIDVFDGNEIRRVATAHADAAKEPLVKALEQFPPRSAANPIMRAYRSERTVLVGPSELALATIPVHGEHRRLLEQLAPRFGIFAPMSGRDGVMGVVSFVSCAAARPYGPEEVALAEDLAHRLALGIGNARLFHAALRATEERDQILAVVAHDLRNPLGAISGAAEMLQEYETPAAMRNMLDIIVRCAERMDQLIQDLLNVSRNRGGRLTLERSAISAKALLDETVLMLRPLADARGIELQAHRPIEDITLHADTARLLQVLSNLVGNAIKFTMEGGRVDINCTSEHGAVRFDVVDTGPGIARDQLPHVFGRFWQADSADRRGAGLGLSIARDIVTAHGGRIWVESELGRGSTFSFTVPQPT
ncbi:MAG TPA: GAF domain-containing sensor histidine kinase [Longimicrobiales bacterium]|nr:GAF domain-containing sensor histidine kinase [Longimicrobiales bacterium]